MAGFFQRLFAKMKPVQEQVKEEVQDEELSRSEFLLLKRTAKQKAKSLIGKKFVVGKKYYFKSKQFSYELKKFIYTVNRQIVNKVIVKPLYSSDEARELLNPTDCKRYHIKYEPDLIVLPMSLNWRPL